MSPRRAVWEVARREIVERTADGSVLELEPGTDSQRILDAARQAGAVTRFAEVEPTLAELFREVVTA